MKARFGPSIARSGPVSASPGLGIARFSPAIARSGKFNSKESYFDEIVLQGVFRYTRWILNHAY